MTNKKPFLKFPIKGLLIASVLSAPFVALSIWQANRAAEKTTLLAENEFARLLPATTVRSLNEVEGIFPGQSVKLQGKWLADFPEVVLDNRPFDGQPGYQVFAPMSLASGGVIFVFRGWFEATGDRNDISRIVKRSSETNISEASQEVFMVSGQLWDPDKRPFASDTGTLDDDIYVAQQLSPQHLIAQSLATENFDDEQDVASLGLWADATDIRRGLQSIPVPEVTAITPDRHRGYAFTWGGIAVTLFALVLFLFARPSTIH